MAGTGEGKKEEADYKRLHSFPLIRVSLRDHNVSEYKGKNIRTVFERTPVHNDIISTVLFCSVACLGSLGKYLCGNRGEKKNFIN